MVNANREDGPVIRASRARSGRMGRSVFWVLLISTLLAVLGLFIAWTLRTGDLASTEDTRNVPAESRAFEAPIPAAVTPPPETSAPSSN